MNRKFFIAFCFLLFLLINTVRAQVPRLWATTTSSGDYSYMDGTLISVNADGSGLFEHYVFSTASGTNPYCTLVLGNDNNMYGLTPLHGGNNGGTIFSFDPTDDQYTDVFDLTQSTTGYQAFGSLCKTANGTMYGMTSGGGYWGYGTAFMFNPVTDKYTDIHDFNYYNGGFSFGSFIQTSDGNIWGTCTSGYDTTGLGILFYIDTTTNTFHKVHNFSIDNGGNPTDHLLQASNGKLYGLRNRYFNDYGAIYSYDIDSNKYTALYNITDSLNGLSPVGGLVQSPDGLLYGVTEYGGVNGLGVIFTYNIDSNKFTKILDFSKDSGYYSSGDLILASDSNIYGTTAYGGYADSGGGVIFKLNPVNNSYKKVFIFDNVTGEIPEGGLLEYDGLTTGDDQLSKNKNQLSIYPNPTSGAIKISSTKNIDEVAVTNLLGQVVFTSSISNPPPNSNSLATNQFTIELNNEGMYFVAVTSNSQTIVQKVIVVR